MGKLKSILTRIGAVAVASGLGTIGAGSLIGVEVWKAAALAAVMAVAVVIESLARAYVNDGSLSQEEIDASFVQADAG